MKLSKEAREVVANAQIVCVTDLKVMLGLGPVSPATMMELDQFFNEIRLPVEECASAGVKALIDMALGITVAN